MKTTDSQFLALQTAIRRYIRRRVEILPELGAITDRDSATQIKINGDITGDISNGDKFIIPFNDFETEYTITSNPSHSGGKTTLICSGATFPAADDIDGLQVACVHDVTADLLQQGMGTISRKIEGEQLNNYIADDVDITFENSDNFYYANDDSGLLQSADIYHIKIIFYYNGDDLKILYFGGLVTPDNIYPEKNGQTIKVISHGHLKGLEAFPAFNISEQNGSFLKLKCLELIGIDAGANINAGVKQLKYKINKGNLPGVEIKAISQGTPPGIRSLKFRYPNLFRYYNGDWTAINENLTAQTLTDADSNTLTIDTTNYDVQDREVFLQIVSDLNVSIKETGYPVVTFNDGHEIDLQSDFSAVLHNNTSTGWTDESAENEIKGDVYAALDEADGTLYLFCDKPFYGIDVEISSSDLVGTIAVKFSQGLNSWSNTISITDTTSNMTVSGAITWTQSAVSGWRETTIEPGGSLKNVTNKYCIKIELSAYTSGAAQVDRVKRRFILHDKEGNALTLKVKQDEILFESLNEDIIVRQISDTWTVCVWKKNIFANKLLEYLLTACQFPSGQQDLSDLKLTLPTAAINVWGQAPIPFYDKRVTALEYDSENSRLWLGVENELWYFANGEFTKVDEIPYINNRYRVSIRRLQVSGGYCHGVAWYDRYDLCELPTNYSNSGFRVIVFRSSLTIITYSLVGAYNDWIMPGEQLMRQGKYVSVSYEFNQLGIPHDAGENLIIPFPQLLKIYQAETSAPYYIEQVLYDTAGLESATRTGAGAFYFGDHWPGVPNSGKFYPCKTGHYCLSDNLADENDRGWIKFKFRLGNSGFAVWDMINEKWLAYKLKRDDINRVTDNAEIGFIDYTGAFTTKYDHDDSQIQILDGYHYSDGNLYYCMVKWDDDGTDLSEFSLHKLVIATGVDSLLWGTITDAAQAGQSITNREDYQAILELVYNGAENTLHGCMLDRDNFEYHYFVYDIANDKMYSTQTGSGFTFDKHRQIKNFIIMNNQVYAVVVDKRYRRDHIYLIKGVFAGTTITMTKIDDISMDDYDHNDLIVSGYTLYGVTESGKLWQYSTTIFPMVQVADFGDQDCRQVLNELIGLANMLVFCESNRKIYTRARNVSRGQMKITEDDYILKGDLIPRPWQHKYDGVVVSWRNPVTDQEGEERAGDTGWGKRVLNISNSLIQNYHLARILAAQLYTFFSVARETLTLPVSEMLQMEMLDTIQYNGSQFNINKTPLRIITGLDLEETGPNRFMMNLQTLEKTT